ncbi:MAG: hypothetical protein GX853_07045 [Chloroflexi bacterium]|nr:hypothetical protein [Chloroflexota bacterium]
MEKIKLIYSDADILVIDKPSGLLSIADGYDPTLPHLKAILQPEYGPLWMVHHLDKESSGVMVLARNAESLKDLNQQFMDRTVKKLYHCLVNPVPTWQTQTCLEPLSTNTGRKHLTRVDLKTWQACPKRFKPY